MIDFLKDNLQNIVLIVGACAILFLPQIKAGLALLKEQGNDTTGGGGSPPPAPANPCGCCCPEEEEVEPQPKSEWVVEVMSVRAYCLQHRLLDGVTLCEDLISVLVKGQPQKLDKGVEKAIVMTTKKEVRQ